MDEKTLDQSILAQMNELIEATTEPADDIIYRNKSLGFDRIINETSTIEYAPLGGIVDPRTLMAYWQKEDWIFIPVDRTASKLANVPLQVHKKVYEDGEEVLKPHLGHPLQLRLDRPNPKQTSYEFIYNVATEHMVCGNSVIYNASAVNWMIQTPISMLQLNVDATGDLKGFNIVGLDPNAFPTSQIRMLKIKDCIHIKRPNPNSVHWGLSPLLPANHPILFNKYSNEYLTNFYKKGALPGMVIEMDSESNAENVKKLIAEIERAYAGRTNQRKNMILPKGLKVADAAHTLADQQLIEFIRQNRETIINIWQVPKHELSIAESGSLGSEEAKVALRNFWQGPIMTLGRQIEDALNQAFFYELGAGYVIKFNYSAVPALQENATEQATTAGVMLQTMTLNEVRKRVWKLPAIEGGDRAPSAAQAPQPAFSPFGHHSMLPPGKDEEEEPKEDKDDPKELIAQLADELKALKASLVPKEEEPPAPTVKDLNSAALLSYRKAADGNWVEESVQRQKNAAALGEHAIKDLWVELLAKQVEACASVARKMLNEKSAEIPSKRKLRRAIDEAMDVAEDDWTKRYVEGLSGPMEAGYQSILDVPFNKPHEGAIEALRTVNAGRRKDILEARGIETFNNISATTTNKMMNVIEAGVKGNKSIGEIAAELKEVGKTSLARANVIAQQETLTAMSLGEEASRQDAKSVIPRLVKTWLNSGDDRVRGNPGGLYPKSDADHWHMQGEIVGVDDKFSNGLSYPRDPDGPANESIGCRCTVLTVSEDDLARLGLQR